MNIIDMSLLSEFSSLVEHIGDFISSIKINIFIAESDASIVMFLPLQLYCIFSSINYSSAQHGDSNRCV